MPFVSRFIRLVGVGTFPETRGLIVAVARSGSVRGLARRAVHDRSSLVRELGDVHQARALVRAAAIHPATREFAGAGLVFLPGRFLPRDTRWRLARVRGTAGPDRGVRALARRRVAVGPL